MATKNAPKAPAKKAPAKKATAKAAARSVAPAKKPAKKAVKVIKGAKKSAKKPAKKVAKKAEPEPETRPFNPNAHVLVPRHEVLDGPGITAFFEQYDIQPTNLPTIFIHDAALQGLPVKIGDIIKITRTSPTAGTSVFYRRVAYE